MLLFVRQGVPDDAFLLSPLWIPFSSIFWRELEVHLLNLLALYLKLNTFSIIIPNHKYFRQSRQIPI
jgi:hypothetical protein